MRYAESAIKEELETEKKQALAYGMRPVTLPEQEEQLYLADGHYHALADGISTLSSQLGKWTGTGGGPPDENQGAQPTLFAPREKRRDFLASDGLQSCTACG